MIMKTSVFLVGILLCARLVHASPGGMSAAVVDDRAAFEQMKTAFERAVNENRFDLLAPYIDPSFKGTSITGTPMLGPEQIAAFMARARMLMGTGAKYHLILHPRDLSLTGDRAKASGTTEEEITLPDGQVLRYKADWNVDLSKRDGKWQMSGMQTQANMRDKLTVAAHVVASRIWMAGLNLSGVKLNRPDFDQDGGYHNPMGVESAQAQPNKTAQNGLKPADPKKKK
jgi:hypothetical protein